MFIWLLNSMADRVTDLELHSRISEYNKFTDHKYEEAILRGTNVDSSVLMQASEEIT